MIVMFRPFFKEFKNGFDLIIKRSAGHSKWQNIRHTKGAKDLEKSKLFAYLGQRIRISIQENANNNNPDTNFQLAQALENAKRNNMPAATIQNFIKNAQTDKDKAKSTWLTVKGPRGTMLLISCLSAHFVNTRNEIASILRKNGGVYVDGARGLFEEKGIVIAIPSSDLKDPTEMAIDHAIEVGAEDVKPLEDKENSFLFTCPVREILKAKTKLIELKYTIQESDIIYVPKTYAQNLTNEDMDKVSKLIEKIEGHPDVVSVYDNVA